MYTSNQLVCRLQIQMVSCAWAELCESRSLSFVVSFLPAAKARANKQNMAWLPVFLNMVLVLLNFHQQNKVIKIKPLANKPKINREKKWQLQTKNNLQTSRNTMHLLLTSSKSKGLWRKNTFCIAPSSCTNHACKAAQAINSAPGCPVMFFKVCLPQQPLHYMGCMWIFSFSHFSVNREGGKCQALVKRIQQRTVGI